MTEKYSTEHQRLPMFTKILTDEDILLLFIIFELKM